MAVKFTNNATSTLAGAITNVATALAVQSADAAKFPAPLAGDWFPVTLVDSAGNLEIMQCTARSGATLTVVRAQEGTAARAFPSGARVDHRLTAAALGAGLGGASVTIGDSPPPTPTVGSLWWESDTGKIFIWFSDANSSQWVEAYSNSGPPGPAGAAGPPGGLGEAPNDTKQYARKSLAWAEVVSPPADWNTLANKPLVFPPALPIAWTDVSGKPTTFTPAAHTHPESEIVGLVTDLANKEPVISAGTASQYWKGNKTWATLDKAAVGLANVDNTSDLTKPVSTATTLQLETKEPLLPAGGTASNYLRGNRTWGTPPGALPVGGATGQVLTKISATDYAATWQTPSGGSGGGISEAPNDGGWYARASLGWLNIFGEFGTKAPLEDAVFTSDVTITGNLILSSPGTPGYGYLLFGDDWSTYVYADGFGEMGMVGYPVFLEGPVSTDGQPTAAEHLTTKLYVDTKAPLNSPVFTGDPKAVTTALNDNDTSIATTAFVQGVAALYMPLNNGSLTGSPSAPTPTTGDNTTRIATTAFVQTTVNAKVVGGKITIAASAPSSPSVGDVWIDTT